jgi:hypothetical protein
MATLKNTTFNTTGNLTLPVGNTGQRPGSPVAGMVRFNNVMNILEFYNGTSWQMVTGFSKGTLGTGGQSIEYRTGGIVHLFTSVGSHTFTPAFTGNIQVLVVAGGGGGGTHHGGGGGGGGVLYSRSFPVTSGTPYPVTVGGGAPSGSYPSKGPNGSNSVFSSLTATGGGAGGSWNGDANGNGASPGGSGGGAATSGDGSGVADNRHRNFPGNAVVGQGFPGGSGIRFNQQGENLHASGGGGGAGGSGSCASDHAYDGMIGNGGPGAASDILGDILYWGAGGGGAQHHGQFGKAASGGIGGGGGATVSHGAPRRPPSSYSAGGLGGGQALNTGLVGPSPSQGGNAGANTGAGGGATNNGTGGTGGSGIVLIRY